MEPSFHAYRDRLDALDFAHKIHFEEEKMATLHGQALAALQQKLQARQPTNDLSNAFGLGALGGGIGGVLPSVFSRNPHAYTDSNATFTGLFADSTTAVGDSMTVSYPTITERCVARSEESPEEWLERRVNEVLWKP